MNNLILRTITSLILIPIFLFMIFFHSLFIFLIIFLFLIIFYEIFIIYKKKSYYLFFSTLLIIFVFIFSLFQLRGTSNLDYSNLIWIIVIVWLSDIGGYFFGNLLKGPKLSKYSPNKTISGFFGSIILSQLSFFLIQPFYEYEIFYTVNVFLFQLFISLSSILGDLFFSYIKRKVDIKDYSQIIPGHGGLLDRIDGLIFAVIISFLLKY